MISRADVVGAGEEYSSADGEGGAIVELFELLVGIIPIGAQDTYSVMKIMNFHVQ